MKISGMKRILVATIAGSVVAVAANAQASLQVLEMAGEKVTYDDFGDADPGTGQYWFWNLNAFTWKTWAQQQAAVTALNTTGFFGFDNWRIATATDVSRLWSYDLAGLNANFRHAQPADHWSITRFDYSLAPGTHQTTWHSDYGDKSAFPHGSRLDSVATLDVSVWVVSDGHAIPEPSTLVTFAGLLAMGLIGYWRRSRRLSRA